MRHNVVLPLHSSAGGRGDILPTCCCLSIFVGGAARCGGRPRPIYFFRYCVTIKQIRRYKWSLVKKTTRAPARVEKRRSGASSLYQVQLRSASTVGAKTTSTI
jgi:hypothetical protein